VLGAYLERLGLDRPLEVPMRSLARNLPAALLLSVLAPSLTFAAVPALPLEPLAGLRAAHQGLVPSAEAS